MWNLFKCFAILFVCANYYLDELKHQNIFVSVKPEVEVQKNLPADVFKEGDVLSLSCHVKKSNPLPYSYSWYKDGKNIGSSQSKYLKYIQPDDGGSYTCIAENIVGTGQSLPVQISVQCKFYELLYIMFMHV